MPQLTFTRLIACMLVVLYHESNEAIFSDYEKYRSIIKFGDASVSYFFLLSGFILNFNQLKTNIKFDYKNTEFFWLKRFARIYPVYFFALSVCIIQFYYNVLVFLMIFQKDLGNFVSSIHLCLIFYLYW